MKLDSRVQELVVVHALTWLVLGGAVGLLLATLLLVPRFGDLLGPLTYGRWVPVHLNLQLYGWCSLPMIGVLFRLFLPSRGVGRLPRWAVGVWSGSLLFAAVSWLAGHSSGKLFLEWTGPARVLLLGNLLFLGVVLTAGFVRRLVAGDAGTSVSERWSNAGRGLLLAALFAVPLVMHWAAGPEVYPSINPDSGGATGGSLLGSTLGIIAVICACPFMIGLRSTASRRFVIFTLVALAAHFGLFALLDHGDRSNYEIGQMLALASLLVWFPLLASYLQKFDWPEISRPWLAALCTWSAGLLFTGVVQFLPGLLDRWKFTNALVAHAHLAMAGMLTSFLVLFLIALNRQTAHRNLFGDRSAFVLWQAGCLIYIASMMVLGTIESVHTGLLFRSVAVVNVFYAVRWIAGAMMLAASLSWLGAALHNLSAQRSMSTAERPDSASLVVPAIGANGAVT